MADIFISYGSEDLARIRPLAEALEAADWSVFWDRTIPAGRSYHQVIETELEQARCVVVAWSKRSVKKTWVINEADDGREREILVPVMLDPVKQPLAFRHIQAANLVGWDGSSGFAAVRQLINDVEGLLGKPVAPAQEDPGKRDCRKDGLLEPEMLVLPSGRFLRGDITGKGEPDERPVEQVSISRSVAIAKYQVTFQEYDVFAQATGRDRPGDEGWGRGRRPVINVSWKDARAYADWLSKQTGKRYRLPTEAEWEYAARAATESDYWWGDGMKPGMAVCDGCKSDWEGKVEGSRTARVDDPNFEPNAFGLYHTAGNVLEWVQDCWHDNYEGAPKDGSAWEEADCAGRVMRGGSWYNASRSLRSSTRFGDYPVARINDLGFRLAQDVD